MRQKVIIIGAGFAGLCMAIKLKEAGIHNFVVLEKGDQVGGTWYFNRYPGAACDVPSCAYSYSFEPNPQWSRHFAAQPEIEAYIHHCVEKYQLADHVRCQQAVTEAKWHDGSWVVSTAHGDEFEADFVVSAVGQLNAPSMPDIDGIDTFTGNSFHSARWPSDIDLSGKRVAVIGAAASAVQLIPEVAKQAAHLRVFQRTPNYLIPRFDRPYLKVEKWLFKHVPMVQKLYRWLVFNQGEWLFFPAMRRSKWAQRIMAWLANWQLKRQVSDLELRELLTPRYEIGCKRVLMCDDYYPALMRPNVSLETAAITAVNADGVVTTQGHFECDTIVYATGFKATEFLQGFDVFGRDGLSLHEKWAGITPAYRSVCIAGFPNFFTLYGPNSNLGSNSIIAMIEAQVGYVMQCVTAVERGEKRVVEVSTQAEATYQTWLVDSLAGTVWLQDCPSWYKNAEGGLNNNWPWSVRAFQRHMAVVDWADFSS